MKRVIKAFAILCQAGLSSCNISVNPHCSNNAGRQCQALILCVTRKFTARQFPFSLSQQFLDLDQVKHVLLWETAPIANQFQMISEWERQGKRQQQHSDHLLTPSRATQCQEIIIRWYLHGSRKKRTKGRGQRLHSTTKRIIRGQCSALQCRSASWKGWQVPGWRMSQL